MATLRRKLTGRISLRLSCVNLLYGSIAVRIFSSECIKNLYGGRHIERMSNFRSSQAWMLIVPRIGFVVALLVGTIVFAGVALAKPSDDPMPFAQHVVTIYDQGEKRVVLTKAGDVRQTLAQADIQLAQNDRVEPSLDTRYEAADYTVNIYRAYPVMINDGMKRKLVLTPYTTARDIAKDADIAVRDEDKLTLTQSTDMFTDGIGTNLTIKRATPVTLMLYGVPTKVYTQASTVDELLAEKHIVLGENDTVSTSVLAVISADMTIEVWRNGVQTVTLDESIEFPVRQVLAMDKPVGHREVQTLGKVGKKKVVYEVTRQDGREVGRTMIQSVVTEEPKEQVELVGNKANNSLTKSKGAQQFIDSRGVAHRETYYDLPMNVTMGSCGGGDYTIRTDGAKVDKDGYILVAANLGNYPRCSIVETSMGLGKVYDTGGFAAVHPHGFDLATDWTNNDGR